MVSSAACTAPCGNAPSTPRIQATLPHAPMASSHRCLSAAGSSARLAGWGKAYAVLSPRASALARCGRRRDATRTPRPQGGRTESRGEIVRIDSLHAGLLHGGPRGGERAAVVDPARGVIDHEGLEARMLCIHGGPSDAEIGREPGDEDPRQAALLEVSGEPGRGFLVRL